MPCASDLEASLSHLSVYKSDPRNRKPGVRANTLEILYCLEPGNKAEEKSGLRGKKELSWSQEIPTHGQQRGNGGNKGWVGMEEGMG